MQGYGNTVVVDHGNGLMTLYAHNEQLLVKVGDSVGQGTGDYSQWTFGRRHWLPPALHRD